MNWNEIIAALQANQLKKLNLNNSGINAEKLYQLASALENNSTLTELSLCNNNLGVPEAEAIVNILRFNTHIVKLKLSNNSLGSEGLTYISEALAHNVTLQVLELCGNKISNKGVAKLAEALKSNRKLKELNLTYNWGINDKGMMSFLDMLVINTTLLEIGLQKTKVSDELVTQLGSLLARNKSTASIVTEITNEGYPLKEKKSRRQRKAAKHAMKNVADNIHLLEEKEENAMRFGLQLPYLYQDIKEIGKIIDEVEKSRKVRYRQKFENLIEFSHSVVEQKLSGVEMDKSPSDVPASLSHFEETIVKLHGNRVNSLSFHKEIFDIDMLTRLSTALKQNKSLNKLSFKGSDIGGDEGGIILIESLKGSATLQDLDLRHTNLTERSEKLLLEMIEATPSILKLNLQGNKFSKDLLKHINTLITNNNERGNIDVKVYLESGSDAKFYEGVYYSLRNNLQLPIDEQKMMVDEKEREHKLLKINWQMLSGSYQLKFYNSRYYAPKEQKHEGGIAAVTRRIQEAKDGYVFGVIDRDYDVNHQNLMQQGIDSKVVLLSRHSLENFIFDPVIFCSVLTAEEIEKCIRLSNLRNDLIKVEALTAACLKFKTLMAEQLFETRSVRKAIQRTLNKYFTIILGALVDYNSNPVEHMRGKAKYLYQKIQRKIANNSLTCTEERIVVVDGNRQITIAYPKEFLEIRGHDIEAFFIGQQEEAYNPIYDIINRIHRDNLRYIPIELIDLFTELHTKFNSISKPFAKLSNSLKDKSQSISKLSFTDNKIGYLDELLKETLPTSKKEKVTAYKVKKHNSQKMIKQEVTANLLDQAARVIGASQVVYLESGVDAKFYENIFRTLRNFIAHQAVKLISPMLSDSYKLSFFTATQGESAGFKAVLQRLSIDVKNDDIASKSDIYKYRYGIIDNDYNAHNHHVMKQGLDNKVVVLSRHSLENFIFDPFIFCSSLSKKELTDCIKLNELIDKPIQKNELISACLKLKKILESRKLIKQFGSIQETLDIYFRIILEALIKHHNKQDTEVSQKTELLLQTILDRITNNNSLCNEKMIIVYGNDGLLDVAYPKEFLEIRGHDIETFFTSKNKIAHNIVRDIVFRIGREGLQYIPLDLVAIFKELHSKINLNWQLSAKPQQNSVIKKKQLIDYNALKAESTLMDKLIQLFGKVAAKKYCDTVVESITDSGVMHIKADGNCLFNSILLAAKLVCSPDHLIHQQKNHLALRKLIVPSAHPEPHLYKKDIVNELKSKITSVEHVEGESLRGLRGKLANKIANIRATYHKAKKATARNKILQEVEADQDKLFAQYIKMIQTDGTWGGEHEIDILSQVLSIKIVLVSDNRIFNDQHDIPTINLYYTGDHYYVMLPKTHDHIISQLGFVNNAITHYKSIDAYGADEKELLEYQEQNNSAPKKQVKIEPQYHDFSAYMNAHRRRPKEGLSMDGVLNPLVAALSLGIKSPIVRCMWLTNSHFTDANIMHEESQQNSSQNNVLFSQTRHAKTKTLKKEKAKPHHISNADIENLGHNNNDILYLENCGISNKDFKRIAEVLEKYDPFVYKLNLGHNFINDRACPKLNDIVVYSYHLKELNLSRNMISSIGLSDIAAALRDHQNLEKINISGNSIGNKGAIIFAEILAENHKITYLNLAGNKISDEGAAAIANNLLANSSLQILILERNRIKNIGLAAMANMFNVNTILKLLDLSYNPISLHGIVELTSSLKIGNRINGRSSHIADIKSSAEYAGLVISR